MTASDQPVINIPDDDDAASPAHTNKQEKGKQPEIPSNASDAGSYDGEFADVLDPAMMDEEEVPHAEEHLPGSQNGEKPKFTGGYNAMKSFNGQMYSGRRKCPRPSILLVLTLYCRHGCRSIAYMAVSAGNLEGDEERTGSMGDRLSDKQSPQP